MYNVEKGSIAAQHFWIAWISFTTRRSRLRLFPPHSDDLDAALAPTFRERGLVFFSSLFSFFCSGKWPKRTACLERIASASVFAFKTDSQLQTDDDETTNPSEHTIWSEELTFRLPIVT